MTATTPRITPELATGAAMATFAGAGYLLALTGLTGALQPAAGLHGTLSEAAAIATRNGAVAAAFILAAHAPLARRRAVMLTIDALGFAILLPVTLLVGRFLAAPGAWRYFPHAPLELAALAAAFGWWWRHHDQAPTAAGTARRLALVLAALAVAAAIETFAAPHIA